MMKRIILFAFIFLGVILELFTFLESPQILGLFIDMLGAYFLTQGFITQNWKELVASCYGRETDKLPGNFSENLIINTYTQNVEARTGFLILVLGFVLQGIGSVYPGIQISNSYGLVLVLLIIILVTLIHDSLLVNEKILNKADKEIEKLEKS